MTISAAWHALDSDHVLQALACGPQGLERSEILKRRHLYGANSLPVTVRPRAWRRFLAQFNNTLIYVLLAATLITALMGHGRDTLVILAVILINAMIGFVQENKAEHAMDAIRDLLAPLANVVRDGRAHMIPAIELVPGDIILLAAGDKVPADLRILSAENALAQEAILTGESFDVVKDNRCVSEAAPLFERRCMLYSGTLLTHGSARAVVVATGQSAEMGKIGQMVQSVAAPVTPLIRKINRFARGLTGVILAVSAMVFFYGLFVRHISMSEMFMTVVGIAVAAIPEGLPAVISITLALGVVSMARRNAIVRHLPAIESLGSVNVICTDKTGTLTRNELSVSEVITAEHRFQVTGAGYAPEGDILFQAQQIQMLEYPVLSAITRAAALNNDARLHATMGLWELNGEPTEGALLSCAIKAGHNQDELRQTWPRTACIPFSAEARLMATLHHHGDGAGHLYVKGAPETILAACTNELLQDGTTRPLRNDYWSAMIQALSAQGQRILAVAQSRTPTDKRTLNASDMQGLTLLGLFGIMDVMREEVPDAIRTCHQAGIAVKMITGDHVLTAAAMGKILGLCHDGRVITGSDIERMTPAALADCARDIHLFARMNPKHKLKLVQALQADGLVVAMTGDGVNDAPALKAADIGIAMGKGGTEVAKQAAQIVLADDCFVSIVHAIEEGRSIYRKLRRTIQFMLATDSAEAMVLVFGMFGGLILPITPLQILWVNTVTAVTISIPFAFTGIERGIMKRSSFPIGAPLFTRGMIAHMLIAGLFMALMVLWTFHGAQKTGQDLDQARTFSVNLLVMFEVAYLIALYPFRQQQASLWRAVFPAAASIAVISMLQLAFTYSRPMQKLFSTAPLTGEQWIVMAGYSMALLLICVAMQVIGRYSHEKLIRSRASQPKGFVLAGASSLSSDR